LFDECVMNLKLSFSWTRFLDALHEKIRLQRSRIFR